MSRFSFSLLAEGIRQINEELAAQTSRSINAGLTVRNWLIGWYIEEYERSGTDRAEYGEKLMDRLAETLQSYGVSRCERRELYRYREFYLTYPQIVETVPRQLVSDIAAMAEVAPGVEKTGGSQIVDSLSPQSFIDGKTLISRLSFTHIVALLSIEDATKRSFYEIECIRGHWSVRELRRQIGSLYYERSGLSRDKQALSRLANAEAEKTSAFVAIRDPYVFEFLGLTPMEVMSESHLEDQLLSRIQEFLLELGNGFCFEARQKRILIGETQYFVDMVFYHRLLKCHVLVELKMGDFSHENIGQLNTYVNWYRKHMMADGDTLPIGILLCTSKDHALVEYALAGMDNQLFVSRYQLGLPSKAEMEKFIEEQASALQHMQRGTDTQKEYSPRYGGENA